MCVAVVGDARARSHGSEMVSVHSLAFLPVEISRNASQIFVLLFVQI